MLVIITLKPLKVKWRAILKIILLIGLLLYIIPKLVLVVGGIGNPPFKQKLPDEPIRETPMKVEIKIATCS